MTVIIGGYSTAIFVANRNRKQILVDFSLDSICFFMLKIKKKSFEIAYREMDGCVNLSTVN